LWRSERAGYPRDPAAWRALHDLIEFTLLKAYLEANRLEEARHLLALRRPGAAGVPVKGVEALH
jgi:hypothetical protein